LLEAEVVEVLLDDLGREGGREGGVCELKQKRTSYSESRKRSGKKGWEGGREGGREGTYLGDEGSEVQTCGFSGHALVGLLDEVGESHPFEGFLG